MINEISLDISQEDINLLNSDRTNFFDHLEMTERAGGREAAMEIPFLEANENDLLSLKDS